MDRFSRTPVIKIYRESDGGSGATGTRPMERTLTKMGNKPIGDPKDYLTQANVNNTFIYGTQVISPDFLYKRRIQ